MDHLIQKLQTIVGRDAVLSEPDELIVYECDGLPHHKHLPRAVVFPSTTEETSEVMRVLSKEGIAFTPRGAGTGLSGGAVALKRAVVIELARMRRILRIDQANRLAVVQTGVVNSHVSRAVAALKLHYVPDPSSQPSCTIGGNIGENAGGVHCLKYGTTTDHVLGIRAVLAGGEVVDLGGESEKPGYDLRGLFIGSEGTFGIATEATLRLVPIPPTVRTLLAEFKEVTDASHAVSAIIAAGVIPAGLEMMDREIIRAVEASVFAAGLPPDAGAALLIELDGLTAGIDDEADRVKSICLTHGARNCRSARDENERKKLWAARKGAFGAIGRIAPDSMIQDAVVPRSRLPQIMTDAYRIAAKYRLRIANVFHAGDGNLHPLICFDSRSAEEVTRVKEAGRELMETCVRAGGSITGEHGVGLDKREFLPLIFSDNDMEVMLKVRAAFDPTGLINPGKIIPVLRGCGEARTLPEPATTSRVATLAADTPAVVPDALSQATSLSSKLASTVDQTANKTAGNGSRNGRPAVFKKESAAKALANIVGLENVTNSTLPFFKSSIMTVMPTSLEQACEVMKLTSKDHWKVVPAGNSSWLDAGNSLQEVNVIVSTARLNRIVEHEPADLVAITETGISLAEFNEALNQKGQWLPLDPPGNDRATIGGIIASGTRGPQSLGYGPPRAFVIGLKVILCDGKVVKAGGRVVKNVAGYDLCKLFTGSYGTLGLIVEANFKLRPRPESEATVVASGTISSLITAGQSVLQAPLFPVAAELLSPAQAETIDIEADGTEAVLLLRFAGNEKTVREQADTSLSVLASNLVSNACTISEDTPFWQSLSNAKTPTEDWISWRASVPITDLEELIKVTRTCSENQASLIWQAGVGDGRLDARTPANEVDLRAIQQLRNECEDRGGSLVITNASWAMKEKIDTWGELGSSRGLMNRIKNQLDPLEVFSPGRFAEQER